MRHASAGDALQMWRDLTVALMVCEKRMIVHRDIKPSNIMVSVDKSGHVTYKLVDFGIARRLDEQGVAPHARVPWATWRPRSTLAKEAIAALPWASIHGHRRLSRAQLHALPIPSRIPQSV